MRAIKCGRFQHRAAGAEEVMVASASRFALMRELPKEIDEPDVGSLLARMAPVDFVLLDGFRRNGYPKMEVIQTGQTRALFATNDPMVLAVTSEVPVTAPVPELPLSNIGALVDFVVAYAVTAGDESSRQSPGRHNISVAAERPKER